MIKTLDSIALATQDGVATGMSRDKKPHPLFGIPAHELRIEVTLNDDEQRLLSMLKDGEVMGEIGYSMRSCLAQLGVAGFEAKATQLDYESGMKLAEVTTFIADLHPENSVDMVGAIHSLIRQGTARIARITLKPDKAIVGQRFLAINQDEHFDFNSIRLPHETLLDILESGNGRQMIDDALVNLGPLPSVLRPKEFLVGSIYADVGQNCWFIDEQVYRNGKPSGAIHASSLLLDPERSRERRRIEVHNPNGRNEPLSDMQIRIIEYVTDLDKYRCEHRKGV